MTHRFFPMNEKPQVRIVVNTSVEDATGGRMKKNIHCIGNSLSEVVEYMNACGLILKATLQAERERNTHKKIFSENVMRNEKLGKSGGSKKKGQH